MKVLGIIGGTGVYSPDIFSDVQSINVKTEYGYVDLVKSRYMESEVYFLERHGKGHKTAPHNINYLANIKALSMVGVKTILATCAVGSMSLDINPGSFVVIDQFLDFTKGRPATFFNGDNGVVHIDMTDPYCHELREVLIKNCSKIGIKHFEKGTYVCTEGPRFENKAEINMYKILGGDIVGMTNYPEVVLAREANICYAAVGLVTNFATGISSTIQTHKEVMDNMLMMSQNIKELFLNSIKDITEDRKCGCQHATRELGSIKWIKN